MSTVYKRYSSGAGCVWSHTVFHCLCALQSSASNSVSLCAQAGHVDSSGRCVLVHAAQQGHLEVLRFLLKHATWSCTSCCGQRGATRCQAVQQAVTAGARMGHTEVSHRHTYTFIILCVTEL